MSFQERPVGLMPKPSLPLQVCHQKPFKPLGSTRRRPPDRRRKRSDGIVVRSFEGTKGRGSELQTKKATCCAKSSKDIILSIRIIIKS